MAVHALSFEALSRAYCSGWLCWLGDLPLGVHCVGWWPHELGNASPRKCCEGEVVYGVVLYTNVLWIHHFKVTKQRPLAVHPYT